MRFIRLCTEPRGPQFAARRSRARSSTGGPQLGAPASRVPDARPALPELPDRCQARRAPVLGGCVQDGALASPGEPLIGLDSPSAL